MQTDMHYYGTYAIARAAGIPVQDARTIAYAAQFVDDSTKNDSTPHNDGGLLYGIASAHHPIQSVSKNLKQEDQVKSEEQRRVWVPFHFLPGGEGDSLEERLLCVKDSKIAQEMFTHHIELAKGRKYGFELLGIAAHVYVDTFSHYGFSGIGSEYNGVKGNSLKLNVTDSEIENYIISKAAGFLESYKHQMMSSFLESMSGNLGHGGVATYPDRPFLHWRVTFDKPRPGNGPVSDRNNPVTYLEGCERLHHFLSQFARSYYPDAKPRDFEEIREAVDTILRFEGRKEDRIEQWLMAIREGSLYEAENGEDQVRYDHEEWERDKLNFHKGASSRDGMDSHVYKFHQAAAIHRYYVLKDLLPAHGIAVY